VDDGRVAGQIRNYEPWSPRTGILSLPGNIELMGHTYRLEQQRYLIHLPHLVVQMLTIEIHDDDAIVNVVTVMAVPEAVGVVKVAEMSIGQQQRYTLSYQ